MSASKVALPAALIGDTGSGWEVIFTPFEDNGRLGFAIVLALETSPATMLVARASFGARLVVASVAGTWRSSSPPKVLCPTVGFKSVDAEGTCSIRPRCADPGMGSTDTGGVDSDRVDKASAGSDRADAGGAESVCVNLDKASAGSDRAGSDRADAGGAESVCVNAKGTGAEGAEFKCVDVGGAESKCDDVGGAESKYVDAEGAGSRSFDAKGAESNCSDTDGATSKCVDAEGAGSICVDAEFSCGDTDGKDTTEDTGAESADIDDGGAESESVDADGAAFKVASTDDFDLNVIAVVGDDPLGSPSAGLFEFSGSRQGLASVFSAKSLGTVA